MKKSLLPLPPIPDTCTSTTGDTGDAVDIERETAKAKLRLTLYVASLVAIVVATIVALAYFQTDHFKYGRSIEIPTVTPQSEDKEGTLPPPEKAPPKEKTGCTTGGGKKSVKHLRPVTPAKSLAGCTTGGGKKSVKGADIVSPPKGKPPAKPVVVEPVPSPLTPMDPFKIDKEWEKLAGELRKKLQDKNPTFEPIRAPIQLLRRQGRDDTVGFPTNLNLGKRPKGGKKVVLVSDEDYEVLKIGVSERAGHKGVFPFFQGKRTILCERPNYSNSMNAEAIAANCEKFANQLDAQIKRITNRKKNAGKSFAKTDAEIGFLTPIRDKAKQRAEALRKPTVNLYSPGRKWYLLSIADGGQSENRNTILVIFE